MLQEPLVSVHASIVWNDTTLSVYRGLACDTRVREAKCEIKELEKKVRMKTVCYYLKL